MLPLLAPNAALFLDIDGTLVEFEDRPEDVRIPPALRETLAALQQKLNGAVAVISGRELPDIDWLFAPLELAVAGDHGAEARFSAAEPTHVFAPSKARRLMNLVFANVRSRFGAASRVYFEKKCFSIAFHYRGAETEEPLLRDTVREALAPYDTLLQSLEGELCIDVRMRGEDKGKVIDRFIGEPPFHGRVPVYVGDSGTDEDGFAMALAHGGRAIRVVNGNPRTTRATETATDPAELRDWLARSAAALSG